MAFQRRHTTFTAEESKPLAPRGFVLGSTVMLTSVLTTSRYCSTSSRSHRVSMSSAPARSSISGEQACGRATRPRSPREDEPRPVDRSDRPACGRAGAGPRRAVASTPPVFARSPNRIRASCHRCGARRPFTTSSRCRLCCRCHASSMPAGTSSERDRTSDLGRGVFAPLSSSRGCCSLDPDLWRDRVQVSRPAARSGRSSCIPILGTARGNSR